MMKIEVGVENKKSEVEDQELSDFSQKNAGELSRNMKKVERVSNS